MAVLDRNGVVLRPGDHVLIHGVVKWIKADGDDKLQNIEVQTFEPMFPTTEHTFLQLNSKQVKSVAPEVAEAIARAGVEHATAAATNGGAPDGLPGIDSSLRAMDKLAAERVSSAEEESPPEKPAE